MGEVVEKAEITPLCWHSLCTYLDQLSSPLGLISYDSGLAQVISLHLCLLLPDALGFRYSAGGKEKLFAICYIKWALKEPGWRCKGVCSGGGGSGYRCCCNLADCKRSFSCSTTAL